MPSSSPATFTVSGRRSGFTLVEVALALGIVSFAMLSVMSLLPLGLQTSNGANGQTISAQIGQRLMGMIQQTDPQGYGDLEARYYYFDNTGQPLIMSSGAAVPAASIYSACIVPVQPSANPSLADASVVTAMQIKIVNDSSHLLSGTPGTTLPTALRSQQTILPVYMTKPGG